MDAAPFTYVFWATMEFHAGGDVVIVLMLPILLAFPFHDVLGIFLDTA